MQSAYFNVYIYGILFNIILMFIFLYISGDIKSSQYKKNLKRIAPFLPCATMGLKLKKCLMYSSILMSWLYTSFIILLIAVKCFENRFTEMESELDNFIHQFSNSDLNTKEAYIIFMIIKNRELLYSKNNLLEHIYVSSSDVGLNITREEILSLLSLLNC